jgi:hypothetical protein
MSNNCKDIAVLKKQLKAIDDKMNRMLLQRDQISDRVIKLERRQAFESWKDLPKNE